MTTKAQVLVVSKNAQLPAGLTEAMTAMDLDSKVCHPEEALQLGWQLDGVQAVVLLLEQLEQLRDDSVKQFTEQLRRLSVDMLVLAENVSDTAPPGQNGEQPVVQAHWNESCEMLKGRLATLIETRPRLRRLTTEVHRLQQIGQPLSNHLDEVNEEMRLAARLQRDFLPRNLPEINGVRFATIYRPATWVSGDIYDVVRLDEDHVGFYVADAVGHGMPAALLTMFIKRALVTKRITGHSYTLIEPGEVLAQLNADMVDQELSNFQFATCCYVLLNCKTLRLRTASAGHPAPILIDKEGQTSELQVGGSLLGVMPEQQYETCEFQLEQGHKLLLYSDGVELALENDGPDDDMRFRQEFAYLAQRDVQTMCTKLVEMIEQEEGSLHPRDDVTIVGLEIQESGD